MKRAHDFRRIYLFHLQGQREAEQDTSRISRLLFDPEDGGSMFC
jgi:hypothetical protein